MKRSPVARALSLGLALAVPLVPSAARAQRAPGAAAKPLDQALQGPAKEAYGYARTLFDHGDFTGALAKYGQAYELSKDPRLLFDMALCERNLRAYARMRQLLVQYEGESGAALSASDRSAVDAAIAASRNLVGEVTIRVNESGAAVTVDGEAVGTTPLEAPVELDLGTHAVVVRKDGFEPAERSVDVAGGARSSVEVALVASAPAGAHLVVATDDGDALVAVDHQATARGQFDGPVAAGAHDVDITAPGKRAYHVELSLKGGEARSLHVALEDERSGAPVWPWIVGGIAVAAGAAVGGYFLLRPQQAASGGPSGELATVQFQIARRR